MSKSNLKVILHPVRMKIIQSFVRNKEQTVQQLAERITDVPIPSLYRHINTLLDAGFIEVVQENPVRGTIEKVFALKQQTPNDFLNLSKAEHLDLFTTFVAQLISMYDQYLSGDNVDLQKDGVSYRVAELHVTDEEFRELAVKIGTLIMEAVQNEPSPERKVKQLATIIIPEGEKS
ncbi:helix-turn-helix domain-containing protein [Bacillus sp. PK3_68]|uniref:helix-turn-helix domain-containing protein n=1 Tax=Bacillus sp. PK3_68 TaxID=2027408 RepID=UPI000E743A79|nr:helix-turn-helix domain-containing protein [Bacillus sp. PK3_68]RJS62611.1 transcriptional regulator [Bacillus sp. PK3_68]